MDCCRTARRLGGEQVDVVVRSGFEEMKASEWEIEEAVAEDIPIHNFLVPKEFMHEGGRLTGVRFDHVRREVDENGRRRLVPTGEERMFECDDVLVAIGQENSFPWIERDIGIEFGKWDMPVVDRVTFRTTHPQGVHRRGRRLRAGEHHLGGGACARGRHLDRSRLPRRGPARSPPRPRHPRQPEDGHPRVELRQRHRPRPALRRSACGQGARPRGAADGGRARLR